MRDDATGSRRRSLPEAELDAFLSGLKDCAAGERIDAVRSDQARRWQTGRPTLVEEYVAPCPDLAADEEDLLVLIVGEALLRRSLGHDVTLEEYQQRFPELAGRIGLQFEIDRLWPSRVSNVDSQFSCPICGRAASEPAPVSGEVTCPACGAAYGPGAESAVEPESSFEPRRLGKYELVAPVGEGAFGTVYQARDVELHRMVAIKIPRAANLVDKALLERFLREGRSVAQLRHPSIVTVHEIGQHEKTPFLVSEFVQGKTLATVLSSRQISAREAAELTSTLAEALHYAHDMGVVHRDVKPTNIMLDELGAPRLMDFGLARRNANDATMTVDGQLLGTPAYMSPEQARGESHNVDGRSDVYSLGVVLYQMLTGQLPFQGETHRLLDQVLHDDPQRPSSLSRLVPRDLETICLKAMAKEPSRRYATARDLADDLRRYLNHEPIHARAVGGAERLWRWSRRKPALAAMTAAAALLLMALAGGGLIAAVQFQKQAEANEEELYFNSIGFAHRDLTANLPNPGQVEALLEACPEDRRHWEWYCLKRLWRGEPRVLQDSGNHESNSVSFSCDRTRLAAGCADGVVRVWDLKTNKVTSLAGHTGYVVSVAFSPTNPNLLASTSADATVRLWDLTMNRQITELPGRSDAPENGRGLAYSLAFSPDGQKLAACSGDRAVRVWGLTTKKRLFDLTGHALRAACVAFSADGKLVATGDWRGYVRIWDAHTGDGPQTLKRERPEMAVVAGLAFNPNPKSHQLAAVHYKGTVAIWDDPDAEPRTHKGYGVLNGIAFHPSGERLAIAGEDRTVIILDPHKFREILLLRGHKDICRGLAFSPADSQVTLGGGWLLASTAVDRTIRLWDATPAPTAEGRSYADHNDHIWSVAVNEKESLFAAAGRDAMVRVRDLRTGDRLTTLPESSEVVFDLDFSPDGKRLAAAGIDNGSPPYVVRVWDVPSRQAVQEVRAPIEVFSTAFHPSGQWVALGLLNGEVQLASLTEAGRIVSLGKHTSDLMEQGLAIRRDGMQLASASSDGVVNLWDLTPALSGQSQPQEPAANPSSLASPGLQPVRSFGEKGVAVWSLSYSPDGRQIITGGITGRVTLWDAETGAKTGEILDAAHGGFVSASYSPNGRWIVTASEDCTVRAYRVDNANSVTLVHRFRGHPGPIYCVAVGNEYVVTGGKDKTVMVWDLRPLDQKSAPTQP